MSSTNRGLLYAGTAYFLWGVIPLYFRELDHLRGDEIVAHRVVWGMLLLVGGLIAFRRGSRLRRVFGDRRLLAWLVLSSVLIAINWLVFIYANVSHQVKQGSLGYFMNPLVNVLLGMVFLGERLKRHEQAAVLLAGAGVLVFLFLAGTFPWIALTLAFSFGTYTLVRKQVDVDAFTGLAVECILLWPLAVFCVVFLEFRGEGSFLHGDVATDWLLLAAGPTTIIPLVFFAAGVKHLPMKTLGFLQYLSPTLQLILALTVLGETLTPAEWSGFVLIWIAVVIYSTGLVRRSDPRPESDEL